RAASALVISASLATASIRSVLFIRIYSLCGLAARCVTGSRPWSVPAGLVPRTGRDQCGCARYTGRPQGPQAGNAALAGFSCPPVGFARRAAADLSVLYVGPVGHPALPAATAAAPAGQRHLRTGRGQRPHPGQLPDPHHPLP